MPANDSVSNIFANPDGAAEFRNVLSSSHACFIHFYNGHQMEKHKVTSAQLIPQEGVIMSTRKPEDFCLNDSDGMTTEWKMHGDEDLANLAKQVDPLARLMMQ